MIRVLLQCVACAVLTLQPADHSAPPTQSPPAQPQAQPKPPARPAPQPQDQPQEPPTVAERFAARLEALSPTNPQAYYLLGEEVADQAGDLTDRGLAQHLYVLAFELSRGKPNHGSLQAACCLALADLVKAEHDRKWLVALARTLDPRRVPPEWLARQAPATTDSAAYQVATVLGLVRSGDGGLARQLIARPEVKSAFGAYDRMMENMGISGGADGIIREAERWPCPECQNERVVRRGNPPEYRLCPNCSGDPGPALSGREFIAQLRFESLILQGSQRTWAAQVAADGGAPLMDPDAVGLPAAFDVDPSLVLWRGGKWVPDPNAPPAPKPAPPPPPPKAPQTITPVTTSPS